MITVQHHWNAAFEGQARAQVEALLPAFLRASRWFGGKAKTIRSTRFADILRAETGDGAMVLGLIDVSYREGGADCTRFRLRRRSIRRRTGSDMIIRNLSSEH